MVFTNRIAKALARKMGVVDAIEAAGGKVIADTCWNFIPFEEQIMMTDSVKMAWVSGNKFSEVMLDSTEKCIEAAVREKG
jgi:predicted aconitase